MKAGGAIPFRPIVKDQGSADLKGLMELCLEEEPSHRPDCGGIRNVIKKMNK